MRASLVSRCQLQSPATWQAFTGNKTWRVNYWGSQSAERHSHYRHPQVLLYDLGNGQDLELIGVHVKSKINKKPIQLDEHGTIVGPYVIEATETRIKLATKARDVRRYVGAKFDQVAQPGILVTGDCNDGPGHDYFETNYLFFDLISNLQGEVLLAERFFNHALFDYPRHLRWTAKYRNVIQNIPASHNPLLPDHILLSQPVCRGQLPLVANAGGGKVERQAYERANAGSNSKTRTSDHRPVSCQLDDRP